MHTQLMRSSGHVEFSSEKGWYFDPPYVGAMEQQERK